MAIDQTAPVADDLGEVVVELIKRYLTVAILVHQGETKLVLLVLLAVAEHVHDSCKLVKLQVVILPHVKDFEHSVCEKWVALLAQQAHLRPKLLLSHDFDTYFFVSAAGVFDNYLLFLACAVEMAL